MGEIELNLPQGSKNQEPRFQQEFSGESWLLDPGGGFK